MHRFAFCIFAVMFSISVLHVEPAVAGRPLPVAKMKAALNTATPEEDGFLDRVSQLVEQDILPRDMVESTFLWARKHAEHRFQYFKRGLTARAAKIGIRLDSRAQRPAGTGA